MIQNDFISKIADSISFSYVRGGLSEVKSLFMRQDVSWQTRPVSVVSQIARGRVLFQVKGKSGEFAVNEGDSIFIPSGIATRSRWIPSRGKMFFRWAHVNFMMLGCMDIFNSLEFPLILAPPQSRTLGNINEKLFTMNKNRGSISLVEVIKVKTLGMNMLSILIENPSVDIDNLIAERAGRLEKTFAYIENNYCRKITLKALAKTANLSVSRFHDVFKGITGKAPLEYVLALKMKRAQEMLMGTDLTAGEISERFGFPEQFSFSRSFKKHCGLAPSEWRRNANNF